MLWKMLTVLEIGIFVFYAEKISNFLRIQKFVLYKKLLVITIKKYRLCSKGLQYLV
jgi:hypothetical protein